VHLSDGLDLIASDTPDRLAKNAEEWLPCRYIARVGKNAPDVDYRTERLDGVTRHYKSKSADAAFLATESDSSGWTVATYASNCDSVFTNPARTCQHADPRARSLIDGRAMLSLKVLVISSTVTVLKNPAGDDSAATYDAWFARRRCGLLRYAAVPG